MNKHQFKFVRCETGDWEALYLDGRMIAEGHSVTAYNVIDALATVFPSECEYIEVSDERAEEGLPTLFKNL